MLHGKVTSTTGKQKSPLNTKCTAHHSTTTSRLHHHATPTTNHHQIHNNEPTNTNKYHWGPWGGGGEGGGRPCQPATAWACLAGGRLPATAWPSPPPLSSLSWGGVGGGNKGTTATQACLLHNGHTKPCWGRSRMSAWGNGEMESRHAAKRQRVRSSSVRPPVHVAKARAKRLPQRRQARPCLRARARARERALRYARVASASGARCARRQGQRSPALICFRCSAVCF